MQIQSKENIKSTQQGQNIIHSTYRFQHFPSFCLFTAYFYFFPFVYAMAATNEVCHYSNNKYLWRYLCVVFEWESRWVNNEVNGRSH